MIETICPLFRLFRYFSLFFWQRFFFLSATKVVHFLSYWFIRRDQFSFALYFMFLLFRSLHKNKKNLTHYLSVGTCTNINCLLLAEGRKLFSLMVKGWNSFSPFASCHITQKHHVSLCTRLHFMAATSLSRNSHPNTHPEGRKFVIFLSKNISMSSSLCVFDDLFCSRWNYLYINKYSNCL